MSKTPNEILGLPGTTDFSTSCLELRKSLMLAFFDHNDSCQPLSNLVTQIANQIDDAAAQISVSEPVQAAMPSMEVSVENVSKSGSTNEGSQPKKFPENEVHQTRATSKSSSRAALVSITLLALASLTFYLGGHQKPVTEVVPKPHTQVEPRESKVAAAAEHRENAKSLWDQKKYYEAIDELTYAFEADPSNSEYFYLRGDAYYKLASDVAQKQDPAGNFQNAVDDFTKAISLNPRYAKAYVQRGRCQSGLKKYSLALEDFAAALALNPSNSDAYLGRADTYRESKQYKDAESDYSEAIKFDNYDCDPAERSSQKAQAFTGRADCRLQFEEFMSVVADTTMAIGLNPSNAMSFFLRGVALQRLEQPHQALNDLKIAATRIGSPQTWFKLSRVQFELGDYVACSESCSNALNRAGLNDDDVKIYATLLAAVCDFKLKKRDQANMLLAAEANRLKADWPMPILKFMLEPEQGTSTVFQAAQDDSVETLRTKAYVGLFYWSTGKTEVALPLLQEFFNDPESKSLEEWWYAKALLKPYTNPLREAE
ncbi:MAG: tetratricopeptide repeat protein [Cyanobacteria bacterium]|nr:tetratricopeptide repeat protein [Cyanobacteriota bacterium]